MARLNPFIERVVETQTSNLGKILIFCEGDTEKNYFDHFAQIIRNNKNKFSHIDIVLLQSSGNAIRVLKHAEEVLSTDEMAAYYGLYEKYLVFDCDAPDDIQEAILDMKQSPNDYLLLPTNLLFETWLLMHFERLHEPLKKKETYTRMALVLGLDQYDNAAKSSKGIIRQIVGNGDGLKMAIENAKALDEQYSAKCFSIESNIKDMNPYSAVYKLMERVLLEIHLAG